MVANSGIGALAAGSYLTPVAKPGSRSAHEGLVFIHSSQVEANHAAEQVAKTCSNYSGSIIRNKEVIKVKATF